MDAKRQTTPGAGGQEPFRKGDLRIDEGSVRIGHVDLTHIRAELADLGAHGGAALGGAGVSTGELGEVVAAVRELRAATAAIEARVLTELGHTARREVADQGDEETIADRIAADETVAAAHVSRSTAGRRLRTSRRLVEDMPRTLHSLADGRISPEVAHAIARTAGPLTPEERGAVDEALVARIPDLEGASISRWTDEVGSLAHALNPEEESRRHTLAAKGRSVSLRRGPHGMATLSAHVPAIGGALAFNRLSLEAESLRAAGDDRGHQAIMADTLVDVLTGEADSCPPTLDVGIIITDHSLLHPGHEDVARIEGYGTVPFDAARQAIDDALLGHHGDAEDLGATLRRLYTHPRTGELVAVESIARAFPTALARMLRYRSVGRCEGPYCDAPARQADHIHAWAAGGDTSAANGEMLCVGCNQKESFGARVEVTDADERGENGRSVRWTTRSGRSTTVSPPSLDPLAPYRNRNPRARGHEAKEQSAIAGTPDSVEVAHEVHTETLPPRSPTVPRSTRRCRTRLRLTKASPTALPRARSPPVGRARGAPRP